MKKQLTKFSIHQSSKLFALMAAFIYGIMALVGGVWIAIQDHNAYALLGAIILPLVGFFLFYIFYAFAFFFYNICAGLVGGIEYEVEDVANKE